MMGRPERIVIEVPTWRPMRCRSAHSRDFSARNESPSNAIGGNHDLQGSHPCFNNALVVYVYQNDLGTDRINVKPADLQPSTTYDVQSVDTGFLGAATGGDIVANGIGVIESPSTAAHILTLTATTTLGP